MRRNAPPSRLRRAWLALGIALAAVLTWRLWPEGAPEPDGVLIALPGTPETLAPPPGEDRRVPETTLSEPASAGSTPSEPAALPTVARAAPSEDASVEAPSDALRGVRITLPGGGAAPSSPNEALEAAPAVAPGAPDPALTARTAAGVRPSAGPDGRTPFTAYRRLQPVGDAAAVAVLLGGLGLDEDLTRRAVALPPAVSLSFVPYARNVAGQMEAARAAGHEVLVELPMAEARSGAEAATDALGPAALSPRRTAEGNERRLDWLFSRSPAYPMVTNHLGRGVTADTALAAQVMAHAARAGVAYVDDTGQLASAARAAGVPYAAVDILAAPGEGRAALDRAAPRPGEVTLVKLYASGATLAALEAWSREATLTPVSSAVSAP